MKNWEYKTFKDSLHGYIRIPVPFVKHFIDTELFQRLRNIEQTGMRTLYPSARHDRFIHSLGTYHLGVKAFNSFRENVRNGYADKDPPCRNHYQVMADNNEAFWDKLGLLFSIACLLHDCGHSPFSHSLEHFYDLRGSDSCIRETSLLNYELIKVYNSDSFLCDFGSGKGKEHERMSALLVKTIYANAVKEIIRLANAEDYVEDDIEFIARAIIGCEYEDTSGRENQIKNCLVKLLNGPIDVDNLDYIVRDTYMAGLDNTAVDLDRLINSLTVAEITSFEQYQLNSTQENLIVLNGTFQGHLRGKIRGTFDVEEFEGSMSGRVCISGSDNSGIIDVDVESGTYKYSSAVFKSKNDMDADIETTTPVNIKGMDSVYINGAVKGILTGRVLGYYAGKSLTVKIVPAFHKSSLSVIHNVLTARNYEYFWIYGHHKVVYYANYLVAHLLKLSVKFLSKKNSQLHAVEEKLYDLMYLGQRQAVKLHKLHFYHTNDSDIISLFKECYIINKNSRNRDENLNSLYEEFFTRKFKFSVWKSCAEYRVLFSDLSDREKADLYEVVKENTVTGCDSRFYGYFNEQWNKQFLKLGLRDVVWVKAPKNMKYLDSDNTYILYKEKAYRLSDMTKTTTQEDGLQFFYLYYSRIPLHMQCKDEESETTEEPITEETLNKLVAFLKEQAKLKASSPMYKENLR